MRRAFLECVLAKSQKAIRAMSMVDRAVWIKERLDVIEADSARGRSDTLWRFVRDMSGRRRRRPPVAGVMRGPDGVVLQTQEDVIDAWERKFLDEFGGNGVVTAPGCEESTVCFVAAGQDASPWTVREWTERIFVATGKMRAGRAAGARARAAAARHRCVQAR